MTPSFDAPEFLQKITSRDLARERVDALRASGPVVFTNGVFDVLHRGHATYLAHARSLGASLVVALNSDASAKRLGKGPDRPLNNEADRAALIAALEAVSADEQRKDGMFMIGQVAGLRHETQYTRLFRS